MPSAWRLADALRDRGVLVIDGDSSAADGSEPVVSANLRAPSGERPVARARRATAQELIERLVADGHGLSTRQRPARRGLPWRGPAS